MTQEFYAKVAIDPGELPTARGVPDGLPLLQVIACWQQIAGKRFRDDCRFLTQIISETHLLRLWERNIGGLTFESAEEFLSERILLDYNEVGDDLLEILDNVRGFCVEISIDDPEGTAADLRNLLGDEFDDWFDAFKKTYDEQCRIKLRAASNAASLKGE